MTDTKARESAERAHEQYTADMQAAWNLAEPERRSSLIKHMSAAIEAARLEERERCAKIAEKAGAYIGSVDLGTYVGRQIAAAIRGQG